MRCGAALDAAAPVVPVPSPTTLPPLAATKRDTHWTAQFPFGAVPIKAVLRIGRDESYSPIATELSRFDKVSRRHAELFVENGSLIVRDMNSTNGVLVNGIPVAQGKSQILRGNDELAFSSQVRVIIRQA